MAQANQLHAAVFQCILALLLRGSAMHTPRSKYLRLLSATLLLLCSITPTLAADKAVGITANLPFVEAKHDGRVVRIERNPDTFNMIEPDLALTSRPCPPFCIQPMVLAPGVETLGELEVLDYIAQADKNVLLIDSREPEWLQRLGMIPSAISLSWTKLHPQHTSMDNIADTVEDLFGAYRVGPVWNFTNAKTLVLYCNGPWCGQSPTSIRQLLGMGYPAHKIKWYRGGMQDWKLLGLTTIKPKAP
jgi:rhodanese-related sulfurtransferase